MTKIPSVEEWKLRVEALHPTSFCNAHDIDEMNWEHDKKGTIEMIEKALTAAREAGAREEITEDTSDGYHTFKELYEFRLLYNALLFNEWSQHGKYAVHKSTKHSDGEDCFGGGWFIVVATLPTGDISNHYEMKDWDLFICETREVAKEWDGHNSVEVLQRLQALTPPTK